MKAAALILCAVLLSGCRTSHWNKNAGVQPATPEPEVAATVEETVIILEESPAPIIAEEKPKTQKPPKTIKQEPAPEQKKAEENPPAQSAPQIIKNEEGRLIHPWHSLKPDGKYSGPKPKWFGEKLTFKIGWSFITAGEATLQTDKIVKTEKGYAVAAEAYAQSYAVIDALFKVRDINVSWIAADLKRSLGYWQSVREGRYVRDEWTIFDYKNNAYTVYKQDKKGELENYNYTFKKNDIFDMLSSLYFVRSAQLPLKGEVFFDIVNRGEQYPLKVIVHGKETVKVKAGKFDCIVVEPMITGEGIFVSKGKSLKVWLTDDEYKMPVKMSVEVFIGSVKAELAQYSREGV